MVVERVLRVVHAGFLRVSCFRARKHLVALVALPAETHGCVDSER